MAGGRSARGPPRLASEQGGSRSLTGHGTLYKALARLERFGLLASSWEQGGADGRPRRRLYVLTLQGAQVAAAAAPRTTSPAAGRQRIAPGPA